MECASLSRRLRRLMLVARSTTTATTLLAVPLVVLSLPSDGCSLPPAVVVLGGQPQALEQVPQQWQIQSLPMAPLSFVVVQVQVPPPQTLVEQVARHPMEHRFQVHGSSQPFKLSVLIQVPAGTVQLVAVAVVPQSLVLTQEQAVVAVGLDVVSGLHRTPLSATAQSLRTGEQVPMQWAQVLQ
jgi:hypothetical protein